MKIYTIHQESRLQLMMDRISDMVRRGLQGGPVVVVLKRQTRSLDQNSKLWPMLGDVATQVSWYGEYLSKEDWKDIFTASLKKQKVVPGIDGGFVMIGGRTSKMDKQEFSDLIELIYAFGAEHNVKWSEPVIYEEYRS